MDRTKKNVQILNIPNNRNWQLFCASSTATINLQKKTIAKDSRTELKEPLL
jgi:hypothetical protein